jgi:hypothetical protein
VTQVFDTTRKPRQRDIAVLFCLAGASGAALVAQVLWSVPMRWTAGLVVLPASALVVVVAFAGQRRYDRLAIVSDRLIAGAKWGLVATCVYDVVRPLLVWALSVDFPPFRANVIFGSLITGQPEASMTAKVIGWTYHFWNGIGFGTMFALLRPRGAWLAGMTWALFLQLMMMWLYPRFLQVRLQDPGFLATTLVGHAVYGIVLGSALARRGPA